MGVIIGHKIPKNNEHWKLYLILRQIFGIVMAPTLTVYDIAQLTVLIFQHNALYLKLYGPLKPKMHFLVHLPAIIKSIGPPVHYFQCWNSSSQAETNL